MTITAILIIVMSVVCLALVVTIGTMVARAFRAGRDCRDDSVWKRRTRRR